jgi:hypothetical protein
MNEKNILDIKSLVEFSKNLTYIGDYEKMTSLLNNSFNKNYYEYSKIIYNTLCSNIFTNKRIFFNNNVKLANPFDKLLFVVKDKETLLKNISDKGYNVNQGPQQ